MYRVAKANVAASNINQLQRKYLSDMLIGFNKSAQKTHDTHIHTHTHMTTDGKDRHTHTGLEGAAWAWAVNVMGAAHERQQK